MTFTAVNNPINRKTTTLTLAVISLWEAGFSYSDIAHRTNMTRSKVAGILRRAGLKRGTSFNPNGRAGKPIYEFQWSGNEDI